MSLPNNDFKDMNPMDQLSLIKEQQECEKRNRTGPLGGNRYDSRDIEEYEERLRRTGLL